METTVKCEVQAGAPGRQTPLRVFLILFLVTMPLQVGATLAIRAWFSGADPKNYQPVDYLHYYKPNAEAIAHGMGPVVDGQVMTRYPVGYPGYLAVLVTASETTGISTESLVVGMNFLWNLVTMSGAFLLAFKIGGVRPAAVALLLVGLCPNVLFLSASPQPQIPYWAVMVWGLYLIYAGYSSGRLWPFAAAGVLLGLGGLMRPEALTLLGVLAAYLAFSPAKSMAARLARPAILLGAFIVVVSPWILYLYNATGRFVLLSAQTTAVAAPANGAGEVMGTAHLTALLEDPAGHTVELLKRAVMAWYHTNGPRDLYALAMNLPGVALTVVGFAVVLADRRLRWIGGLALAVMVAIWTVSTMTFYLARLTIGGPILFAFVPAAGALWIAAKLRNFARCKRLPFRPSAPGESET